MILLFLRTHLDLITVTIFCFTTLCLIRRLKRYQVIIIFILFNLIPFYLLTYKAPPPANVGLVGGYVHMCFSNLSFLNVKLNQLQTIKTSKPYIKTAHSIIFLYKTQNQILEDPPSAVRQSRQMRSLLTVDD